MKKWLTFALVMGFMVVINLTTCDSGSSSSSTNSSTTSSSTSNRVHSVNDCYGVYTPEGTENYYLLKAETYDDYTKCGEFHMLWYDNDLCDKIYWCWDKDKRAILVSAYSYRIYPSSTSCEIYIDVVGKKMYSSYGEFLDKRNGIPYTFKKQ